MMNIDRDLLELFKVMVVDTTCTPTYHLNGEELEGFITNFKPTASQFRLLREQYKRLPIKTLFTVAERENMALDDLIDRQLLHYVEVYGLGMPGLFNLEVTKGEVITLTNVVGVTADELGDMIRNILYTNAPAREPEKVLNIIRSYGIKIELPRVRNNELRVGLYDRSLSSAFDNGDDAVRHIIYKATSNLLLIKSPEVIAMVAAVAKTPIYSWSNFLREHEIPLAKVFNRHKRVIMALKCASTKSAINRISRLSKTLHTPVKMGISKTFLNDFVKGKYKDNASKTLDMFPVRDKLKLLNVVAYKSARNEIDAFIIRNGKVHIRDNRPLIADNTTDELTSLLLASLLRDLEHLRDRKILLDSYVDYGLPISRKQTFGHLPFGTTVTVADEHISSGIYWHEDGGASDLDLSAIDTNGARVGWGQLSGYTSKGIVYSGDCTTAYNGAMEFLTSRKTYNKLYGLYVNTFSGCANSEFELVVGAKGKDRWIRKTAIRERGKMLSRSMILGFVRNGSFVLWTARASNNRVSGDPKTKALVQRGQAEMWTVGKLLRVLDIKYDTDRAKGVDYDHDLSYSSITFDKIDEMIVAKDVP